MARYYLRYVSNGRIVYSIAMDADDDVAACRMAEAHRGPYRLELWSRTRKICDVPGLDDSNDRSQALGDHDHSRP